MTPPARIAAARPAVLPADPRPDSWRARPAAQQPDWPDPVALHAVTDELTVRPPLVTARECDALRARLAAVARGEAFLLQGGDCAETFDAVTADRLDGKLRTLGEMAAVLAEGVRRPVVTVGRIAGQYAKPRSEDTETRGTRALPAYRGDAVNGRAFTAQARTPDPRRLGRVYDYSAATLNFLRSRTASGSLDGSDGDARQLFTSHEALILEYESALTHVDERTGALYATSGHLLWAGERTRQTDGAHIEFLRQVRNPVGVKLGPATTPDEVLALAGLLDPHRDPGRLTLIARMGADAVREVLPPLVERVMAAGLRPVWVCDPMHGNTVRAADGHKTRHLDAVLDELDGFFTVHRTLGSHAGGVHLELTGTAVTECVGGPVTEADLPLRYETACDPRLNHDQSLQVAEHLARIAGRTHGPGRRLREPEM